VERRVSKPFQCTSRVYDGKHGRLLAEDTLYWRISEVDRGPNDFGGFMSELLKKALQARKAAAKTPQEIEAEDWLQKTPVIESMLKTTVLDGKARATSTLTFTYDAFKLLGGHALVAPHQRGIG